MVDREKVIKALEACANPKIVETCYGECPYAVADDEYNCVEMKRNALALLKQERVKTPEIIQCKDCKNGKMDTASYPQCWCLVHNKYVTQNYFCADGKQKEGQ